MLLLITAAYWNLCNLVNQIDKLVQGGLAAVGIEAVRKAYLQDGPTMIHQDIYRICNYIATRANSKTKVVLK